MSEAYQRVKVSRETKRGAGMVRKELWVWPDAWKAIQEFAARANRKASKFNEPGSTSQDDGK